MSPLISVVMSVYNGEKYLREAVDSIINQTFTDFEFIIINDGSTDDTRAILESYTDDRIVLLHQENIGLTKSLNKGLVLAKGKYFARQDADDISHPARFEKQVAYLEENPDCLVLGTWMDVIDEKGLKYNVFKYPVDFQEILEAMKTYDPIGHGTIMARTNILLENNGYNEKFYYAQDYDFWMRLSEVGELRNLPDELYSLRFWPGSISVSKGYVQEAFVNVARQDALSRQSHVKKEPFVGHLFEVNTELNATVNVTSKHKKIKILYVSHSSEIAGAENSLLTLLKFLDRKVFDPVVILPAEGALKNKIEELGIKYYIKPLEWNAKAVDYFVVREEDIAQRVENIVEIIRFEKPDIVHTNTSVIWEGALAAKVCGIPHIWHLHEKLYEHPSLNPLLPVPLHYLIMNELSEKIVAVSNYLKNQLDHLISPYKLLTIYNGIDADCFKPSPERGLREQLGISAEAPLAVTLGSLIKEKGYDILLTAAYFAKSRGCLVKFLIIGDGSPEAVQSLSEGIEHFEIGDTVFYLGFREDIPQIINACDFLIIPSLVETFSLAALEAMAAGKPVISTDCGGPSEIITNGESGFIVPINDPLALCQKIIDLGENCEKLKVMGEKAYMRLNENFRAEVYAGRFEVLYKNISALGNSSRLSEKEIIIFNSCLEFYQRHVEKLRLLAESARKFERLNMLLVDKDSQLVQRGQQLTEQTLALAESTRQVAERNQLLAESNHQVAERNYQLAESNRQVAELNQQVDFINEHLTGREKEIYELVHSLSWKITAPLRIIAKYIYKALGR
jgi:glycosyltransferase involved in cell wall biosynthesis